MRNTPSRVHTPVSYSLCLQGSGRPWVPDRYGGDLLASPKEPLEMQNPSCSHQDHSFLSACHPLHLCAVGPWRRPEVQPRCFT